MDNLKELLKDKIVNCETEEESNRYLRIFGVCENNYNWGKYKEKTCYHLFQNEPVFSNIKYFLKHYSDQIIYKFSDLIKKKEKNMKIILKFEKVIHQDEMMYKLIDFEGREFSKTNPEDEEYLSGTYVNISEKRIIFCKCEKELLVYRRSRYMTKAEKTELVVICQEAGKRLSDINRKKRLEEKKWNGVERIEI